MKKIYIDGLALVEGHFSGVGQYILGILQGIDQLVEEGKYTGKSVPEVIVIIPYDSLNRFMSFGFRHIKYMRFPIRFRYMAALWHRGWLPPIDPWCGKGNYIFTRFVDMPLLFSKSSLIIYDVSFELYKEFSEEKNVRFLAKFVRSSIKRSEKIFTISHSVANETKTIFNLPSARIAMAYPATNPLIFYRRSGLEIQDIKEKYEITFTLCVNPA